MSAVREAIPALAENGPNARDHYIQELGAFEVARPEHEDRLKRLDAVHSRN